MTAVSPGTIAQFLPNDYYGTQEEYLYALADVLVLPSANEGFGIPVLEAALHRLPIVCSDLASLRAVAGDGATYVPATEQNIATVLENFGKYF